MNRSIISSNLIRVERISINRIDLYSKKMMIFNRARPFIKNLEPQDQKFNTVPSHRELANIIVGPIDEYPINILVLLILSEYII